MSFETSKYNNNSNDKIVIIAIVEIEYDDPNDDDDYENDDCTNIQNQASCHDDDDDPHQQQQQQQQQQQLDENDTIMINELQQEKSLLVSTIQRFKIKIYQSDFYNHYHTNINVDNNNITYDIKSNDDRSYNNNTATLTMNSFITILYDKISIVLQQPNDFQDFVTTSTGSSDGYIVDNVGVVSNNNNRNLSNCYYYCVIIDTIELYDPNQNEYRIVLQLQSQSQHQQHKLPEQNQKSDNTNSDRDRIDNVENDNRLVYYQYTNIICLQNDNSNIESSLLSSSSPDTNNVVVHFFGKRVRVRAKVRTIQTTTIITSLLQQRIIVPKKYNTDRISAAITASTTSVPKRHKAICGRYFGNDLQVQQQYDNDIADNGDGKYNNNNIFNNATGRIYQQQQQQQQQQQVDADSITNGNTTTTTTTTTGTGADYKDNDPIVSLVITATTTTSSSSQQHWYNSECTTTSTVSTNENFPLQEQSAALLHQQYKLYFSQRPNVPNSTTGYTVWDGALLMVRYLEGVCNIATSSTTRTTNDNSVTTIEKDDSNKSINDNNSKKQFQQRQQEQQYSLQYHNVQNTVLVIELGSGCGVAGIASSVLGATNVIVSDLPNVLPLLQTNIDLNIPTLKKSNNNYNNDNSIGPTKKSTNDTKSDETCNNSNLKNMLTTTKLLVPCVCDWTLPINDTFKFLINSSIESLSTVHNHNNNILLLVSDCIWMEDLVEPLFNTIKSIIQLISEKISTNASASCNKPIQGDNEKKSTSFLYHTTITILFTYQRRGKSTNDTFWYLLNQFMSQFVSSSLDTNNSITRGSCSNNNLFGIHTINDPTYLKRLNVTKPDNFSIITCTIPIY